MYCNYEYGETSICKGALPIQAALGDDISFVFPPLYSDPKYLTQAYEILLYYGVSLKNNPKDLNPSYKKDLDLWDCFGGQNES